MKSLRLPLVLGFLWKFSREKARLFSHEVRHTYIEKRRAFSLQYHRNKINKKNHHKQDKQYHRRGTHATNRHEKRPIIRAAVRALQHSNVSVFLSDALAR
jgi:hypothetical protein